MEGLTQEQQEQILAAGVPLARVKVFQKALKALRLPVRPTRERMKSDNARAREIYRVGAQLLGLYLRFLDAIDSAGHSGDKRSAARRGLTTDGWRMKGGLICLAISCLQTKGVGGFGNCDVYVSRQRDRNTLQLS